MRLQRPRTITQRAIADEKLLLCLETVPSTWCWKWFCLLSREKSAINFWYVDYVKILIIYGIDNEICVHILWTFHDRLPEQFSDDRQSMNNGAMFVLRISKTSKVNLISVHFWSDASLFMAGELVRDGRQKSGGNKDK